MLCYINIYSITSKSFYTHNLRYSIPLIPFIRKHFSVYITHQILPSSLNV